MNNSEIEIRSGDELIRLLLRLNGTRSSWTVRADQTQLVHGTTTYRIAPGVIQTLINDEWLVSAESAGGYQFDIEREDDWLDLETARILKARAALVDRHPGILFEELCEWSIFTHPHSAELDSRGFVFKDTDRYEYLVCEGGRVAHPLKKQLSLRQPTSLEAV